VMIHHAYLWQCTPAPQGHSSTVMRLLASAATLDTTEMWADGEEQLTHDDMSEFTTQQFPV